MTLFYIISLFSFNYFGLSSSHRIISSYKKQRLFSVKQLAQTNQKKVKLEKIPLTISFYQESIFSSYKGENLYLTPIYNFHFLAINFILAQ